MNSSPRNEIPIGSDYQAEVPVWDSNSDGSDLIGFDYFVDREISTGPSQQAEIRECKPSGIPKYFSGLRNCSPTEEELRLIGSCIIPMPSLDDLDINNLKAGSGRIDCKCLDIGSTRCVQQHVKEARERMRETLGEEIFTKLGFYEMGEEVASRWNPDEEQTFHEVIYSNPASCGMNFWKVLSDSFRSKKEIVSYYFNVFMLWKRAVQNRSYTLRVDSDDDEDPEVCHGNNHPNSSILDQESEDEEEYRKSPFCPVGEVDLNEGHHVMKSSKVDDLDVGWMDNVETEFPNANVSENNVRGHNPSENTSSGKIVDCGNGIDCSEAAVYVDGEVSQGAGEVEAEKSHENRTFDS